MATTAGITGTANTRIMNKTIAATKQATQLTSSAFNRFASYLPDSLIAGTVIFGIVTMNYPILVLFLFEMEAILAQRALGSLSRYLFPTLTEPSANAECKEGYYTNPTDDRRTLLALFGESESAFPARPLFLLSAVMFYLYSSLLSFQDVIKNLDKDYSTRVTFGAIGVSLAILFVFALYYKKGCVTLAQGAGTVFFGMALGGLGMLLHSTIFGRDAVNFLGLPLLGSTIESRAPLYVCAPTVKGSA